MADTPDFNSLPLDTTNQGKKVSGVMRLVNSISVFIQNIRIANEASDPVLVGGALLTSMDGKLPALDTGAIPVRTKPSPVTPVDKSGTITAGGTAQVLAAANTTRRGLWVKNMSTGDFWVSDIGTAAPAAPSLLISPGDYWETQSGTVSAGAFSIYGATTGQAFTAREY